MNTQNAPPPMSPLCVGEKEAARLTSLSLTSIGNLRKQGKLDFIKVGKAKRSRVLIPVRAIEKFIEANLTTID